MSSLSENRRKITEIEDVDDHILTEILIRLPVRTVHQCKVVSERWLVLISSPHFEKHYRRFHHSKNDIYLLGTIVGDIYDHPIQQNVLIPTNKSTNNEVDINRLLQMYASHIVFVSGDLVLIKSRDEYPYPLAIYNTLTKQPRYLPSPTQSYISYQRCFTYFMGCSRSEVDPTKFKVVLVHPRKQVNSPTSVCIFLDIFVFSSETDDWVMFSVLAPPNVGFRVVKWIDRSQYATSCNGRLFWTDNMIVEYDPFNKPNKCDFIEFPYQCEINMDNACITHAQGCIRLYDWRVTSTSIITIWDLIDYTNLIWCKKYIDLSVVNWHQISREQPLSLTIKGFNPIYGDVVYILLSKRLILAIKLTTKTEKINADLKPSSGKILFDFDSYSEVVSRLFPILPPLWPMPL